MFRYLNKTFIFLIMLLGWSSFLIGQTINQDIRPKSNSPLSRFGLGDFLSQNFAASGGFGGLSAAFSDPSNLNTLNPASLGYLQVTAFEVGLDAKYSSLSRNNVQDGHWSGNLRYMALGFPLKNPINQALDRKIPNLGIGMSFSLQPYTQVGYDIATTDQVDWAGGSVNSLKGTGGSYFLKWGNGIRYKGLSAGVNLGYLFGKITNNSRVELNDTGYDYYTEFLDENSISGLTWDLGLQYSLDFKTINDKGEKEMTGKRLIFGAMLGTSNEFNTNSSKFHHRDNPFFGVQDTILFTSEVKGKGTLPRRWSAGIVFEQRSKFRIGFEYSQANWSSYTNDARPETFSDTWRVRVGAEYIPELQSYNSYFRRVSYRAGFFYGTDPRSLNGEQVSHTALTLGMGFPIILPRQQTSYVNVALEAGQFGISDVLEETYVQMTVGFTMNDNTWFFKRKYN